ncbi:MAG: polysaccharide biosynthesis tyrosine autokinase [Alphaproteobacteria bacterium]|nr:polysaccharide biosynthesis tyrosine autokinase [Alphaproteobacteria bacterium]
MSDIANNEKAVNAGNDLYRDPSALFGNRMQDLEIDLRNFLLMLWRRKLLILAVMVVSLALVFVFVNMVQPRYSAKALIMIENRFDPGPELRALISSMRVDTTLILSEAEVLKSRTLAAKVVDRLDLMNDPEFNPRLRPEKGGSIDALLSGSDVDNSGQFKALSVFDQEAEVSQNLMTGEKGAVIDRFLRNVYARPIPGSFVLQIEFKSEDPKKAALIANTIVDTYIDQRLEAKFKATQKLTEWLDKRLEGLRTQVRESEAAVEEYRSSNNLVVGARVEVTAQQLSELNSQLVMAKAQEAEASAKLDQIKGWINNPGSVETTFEALNSRIVQNLKLEESDIRRKISELSSIYGDQHPKMINARSELSDLRNKMRSELRVVAEGLKAELQVSQARVVALEDSLREIEKIKQTENQASIKLRELARESDSSQMIFDTFLETYKKSDDQESLQEAEARVISYATVPRNASYPNKPLFLSLTAAASFFLGIAISLLLEKLDNAYRTSSQLETQNGYPCFGVIPSVEKPGNGPIGDYIMSKPASNIAESVRTLRMVLNLRSTDPALRPKVVTITSSLPSEGKTTLSSWMARVSAKSGEKVIVVDCDLRRPNLHNAFGVRPDKTIIEFLTDKADLDEVIKRDDASGAHVIYARSVPNNALDLISKDRMRKLIASLRKAYDLVILDSPACLAVSDARVLATHSDQTLYAVSWDDTPREVVGAGVKQFGDFGYRALAFVLTNVDIKRHSKYGYGDAVYYYSRYKQYYSN